MVELSYPHMTAGKTIALIRLIFVSNVMSLLFNMLSRLVWVGKLFSIMAIHVYAPTSKTKEAEQFYEDL